MTVIYSTKQRIKRLDKALDALLDIEEERFSPEGQNVQHLYSDIGMTLEWINSLKSILEQKQ